MHRSGTNHNQHHKPAPLPSVTERELREEIVGRIARRPGGRFTLTVVVLAILFALGIVGFVLRALNGFGNTTGWAYYAATFAYLLTTTQTAPLVSIAMRMAKNHWRRPLARVSELFAVVGILNLLIFLPLLWLIPSAEGRRTLWFGWPLAPHLWDTLAVVLLVLLGLVILYLSALPDFATLRDSRNPGILQGLYRRLAPAWQGTMKQWRVLKVGLGLLGGLYFALLIPVHMLISVDFSMTLVPGWKDSIYPTYHALTSLQASVALVIFSMFLLRQVGGLKDYLQLDQFWAMSKLLLALSLLWFYFWWSGFIIFWYGRQPVEQNLIQLLMVGPYRLAFGLALVLCFAVPLFSLMWNRVRKSILGPSLVSISVLVGAFFDRIRLYVGGYSLNDFTSHTLEHVPATHFPDGVDILIMLGGLAGAALLYLLASRIVPIVSIWEVGEALRFVKVKRFFRTETVVLAKPD